MQRRHFVSSHCVSTTVAPCGTGSAHRWDWRDRRVGGGWLRLTGVRARCVWFGRVAWRASKGDRFNWAGGNGMCRDRECPRGACRHWQCPPRGAHGGHDMPKWWATSGCRWLLDATKPQVKRCLTWGSGLWAGAGSNRRPSTFQGERLCRSTGCEMSSCPERARKRVLPGRPASEVYRTVFAGIAGRLTWSATTSANGPCRSSAAAGG
jgi:hypothetical protein